MQLNELVTRSKFIRQAYHTLEKKHHGSEWIINEDLLAFSNDIGNLDRLVMTKEGRYYDQLSEKLAENIWWLIELSQRLNIDIETELEKFLAKKEQQLSIDLEKNNDKK